MKRLLSLLSIILLLSSCASKRYTKKAIKFEQAGLFEDAAEYYYQAVVRKNTNIKAKLGLQKNGQLSINSKLETFEEAYKNANTKEAVYAFIEADKYYHKLKNIRVNLELDNKYREYYREVKSEYLEKKYAQALELLNRDNFRQASIIFRETISIDKQYKDAQIHLRTCTYEPIYRQANTSLDNQDYRKAYY